MKEIYEEVKEDMVDSLMLEGMMLDDLQLLEEEDTVREIASLAEGDGEWILVDSGAATHAVPLNYAPEIRTEPGRATPLRTATGETVEFQGFKTISYELEQGEKATVRFEVLDVTRPLLSVGKLRKTGHSMYLGTEGEESWIMKKKRKLQVWLRNNVYWLRARRRLPRRDRELPQSHRGAEYRRTREDSEDPVPADGDREAAARGNMRAVQILVQILREGTSSGDPALSDFPAGASAGCTRGADGFKLPEEAC